MIYSLLLKPIKWRYVMFGLSTRRPQSVSAAAATEADAGVTLINVFEVPAGQEDAAISAWEKARDFLVGEPGYISTALHRSIAADARFQLVNVARWTTAGAFQKATARM